MKINTVYLLALTILGPSFFSVFWGVLNVSIPTEISIYLIVLTGLLLINFKNNYYKISIFNREELIVTIFLVIIILFYVIFTISNSYVYEKLILFVYLIVVKISVLSMFNYRVILTNFNSLLLILKRFSLFILLMYFVLFHLGFTHYFGNETREFLFGIENPIWFSRFLVDLLFITIFNIFLEKKIRIVELIIILLGISLLFESGSRGPFLSLFFVLILSFINFFPEKKKMLFFISIIAGLSIAPIIISTIMNFNIYSIYARLHSYQASLDYILENPFGYGFGSFGTLYSGADIRDYPHNILIEFFVELGIIGFITFIVLIYYGLKSHFKNNIFYYLFMISLINAQFSGDINSNGFLFAYLFLSLMCKKYFKEIKI